MATDKPGDDVVRLTQAANPVQAHVIQQALEDEGISCQVVGDYLDAAYGDIPGFLPEVWVHRDDLARAEAVLRQSLDNARRTDEADEPEA